MVVDGRVVTNHGTSGWSRHGQDSVVECMRDFPPLKPLCMHDLMVIPRRGVVTPVTSVSHPSPWDADLAHLYLCPAPPAAPDSAQVHRGKPGGHLQASSRSVHARLLFFVFLFFLGGGGKGGKEERGRR